MHLLTVQENTPLEHSLPCLVEGTALVPPSLVTERFPQSLLRPAAGHSVASLCWCEAAFRSFGLGLITKH